MDSFKISFDNIEAQEGFLNALMNMPSKSGLHIEILADKPAMTVAEAFERFDFRTEDGVTILDQFSDHSPEKEVMPAEPCKCVIKKTDLNMLLLFPRRLCPVHGQYWKT